MCFQHDIVYGDFPRKTAPNKLLCDKAFDIAENSKCGRYQIGLASIVYRFFDKKSTSTNILVTGTDISAGGTVTSANKSAIKNKNVIDLYDKFALFVPLKNGKIF